MIAILAILMFLIPKVSNLSSYLSSYYSTTATVFGTIFGLMVTLSGQFPKNILTLDTRSSYACSVDIDSSIGQECKVPKKADDRPGEQTARIYKAFTGFWRLFSKTNTHSQPNNVLFSYHKKLRYFVGLYGAALGLSLLGLVAGVNTKFNTLVLGLSWENMLNLVPIALFETTFLLIPPTILSLYHLLQVISFRGRITVKSEPTGAMLSLSRRYNFDDNDLADASNFKDLDLITPCTLLLPNGKYKLKRIPKNLFK